MFVLDTGILIYGIQGARKGKLNKAEEGNIPRAVALLKELAGRPSKIVIPAPAAWEFVLDFPIADQPEIWRQMSGFGILPFDEASAHIAAEIMRRHFDSVISEQKGRGKAQAKAIGARQHLKLDIQIVAIAIAHRATKLYTLEMEKFTKWANGKILVSGLPQAQKYLDLDD